MKGYQTENLDGSLFFVNLVLGKWIIFYYAFKKLKVCHEICAKKQPTSGLQKKKYSKFYFANVLQDSFHL